MSIGGVRLSSNKKNPELTDDADLVDQCQAELPYVTLSYEKLVSRYEPMIFQFCLRYLRNQHDAEEVTQDVFLRVFHYIKRFEQRSSFKTWLMRIAYNQSSRRYDQIKRRQERHAEYSDNLDAGTQIVSDPQDKTSGLAMNVLHEMSNDAKEILTLRHLSGLSLKEVASLLNISDSAAKMRHKRAALQFRELYQSKGGTM